MSVSPPRVTVSLADRTYAVRRSGSPEAPPAVFIHGLGGSSLNWTELTSLLADELDCWAVDLNGFGWSPPPRDGDYSMPGHARGVAELIEHIDRGPVHVFANSMGGAVAVQLAATRPDLVRSLTLVSPALPSLRARKTNIHLPVISIPGVGERLVNKYMETTDATVRASATLDLCFADPSRVSDDRRQEAIDEVARRDHLPYLTEAFMGSLRGLMATYFDVSKKRPWEMAKKITCPVVLIYGRQDKLVDPKAAHKTTKKFPDAHVVVIPDSGHVAQMEHPEFVVEAWHRFVRKPLTRSAR